MTMSYNRILSGLLAVVYIVTAFIGRGAETAFLAAIGLILPLACIWFSEAMGGYIGQAGTIGITGASPGIFVCILGWLLLLVPLIVLVVRAITTEM
jgi:hypothetical protein